MTRHEWLVMAPYQPSDPRHRQVLDETGLDMWPCDLVLEACSMCGLQRAVTLRVGATGDRWRTVAQRLPGEPWSRSRTVGACQGRTA